MRLPFSDVRRERVEVQCQALNYWKGYFIIGFPLLVTLNTTAHHPSLV